MDKLVFPISHSRDSNPPKICHTRDDNMTGINPQYAVNGHICLPLTVVGDDLPVDTFWIQVNSSIEPSKASG
jgi:hypothetical protein